MNSHSILTFVQEELDLSAPNKAAMLSLPLEKKWQIWTSRRGTDQADTNLSNNPEDYTDRLRDIAMVSVQELLLYIVIMLTHYFSFSFPQVMKRFTSGLGVLTASRSR